MRKTESVVALLSLFVIAALPGCSDEYTVGPESKNTFEENKEIVRRVFDEVWTHGDFEVLSKISSPSAIFHKTAQYPVFDQTFKEYVVEYRTAFPDLHFIIDELFAERDKVVVRFTAIGTHQGNLKGLRPTYVRARFTGASIFRVTEGMIEEIWFYKDDLGLLTQLHAIFSPLLLEYTWSQAMEPGNRAGDPYQNKAILRRLEDFLNSGSLELADKTFAPGFTNHDPNFPTVMTREGFKRYVATIRTEWSDFHLTYEDMISEGDLIAGRWSSTGVHRGEALGIPPTGKQVTWSGITIHRIAATGTTNAGQYRIEESWRSQDFLSVLIQLGIVRPPGRNLAKLAGAVEP